MLLAGWLVANPGVSQALECGDLNGDCRTSITDAFVLMGRALDFDYELHCPIDEDCASLSAAPAVIGDCFGDAGCLDPEKPYCDDTVCSVCSQDQHCGEGMACDHQNYRCVPYCWYEWPSTTPPHSDICGDMDNSGSISVSDALAVLRTAVGLPVQLRCPSAPACAD